ncbi:hypothetical protein GALMADRAFT_908965 [Galerina marginata CBS 339.88]|uniref:Rhodopsin domain-containing protein n=1 Tax=Galerina marginata (strain CBS 339.88) TaxID=685588 RepID=A0A067SFR8_GALM3|nr:hypothetical protein GALMADRAFT_908965 [Galerina marginata CBS 339.88]
MAAAVPPLQPYLGWKVSMSILHILAICSTIYRLIHRFRIQRIWWDDYLVIVPLVIDCVYCPLLWFRFTRVDPANARTYQILNSYWLSAFPSLLMIWSTRVVLALSLARIFPRKHPARLWAFILIGFMVVSLISCTLVTTLTCKQSSGLLIMNLITDCIKGAGGLPIGSIFIFADDLVGDLLLIIAPLVFFWRLKLPSKERRLIITVFCGSALTLMFVIAFKIASGNTRISMGKDTSYFAAGMISIEVAISLFVCNLTVVSTCLYVALLRLRNQERPLREVTIDASQHSSRACTCLSDSDQSLPLTLTEISTFSSNSHAMGSSNDSRHTGQPNI